MGNNQIEIFNQADIIEILEERKNISFINNTNLVDTLLFDGVIIYTNYSFAPYHFGTCKCDTEIFSKSNFCPKCGRVLYHVDKSRKDDESVTEDECKEQIKFLFTVRSHSDAFLP